MDDRQDGFSTPTRPTNSDDVDMDDDDGSGFRESFKMLQRENYRLQQDNNKLYEKNTLLAAEQVDMQNELGESEGKYQVTKQTLYQFCMNVGTQLGIDQDFILKRIQEDNDNPNAIFSARDWSERKIFCGTWDICEYQP